MPETQPEFTNPLLNVFFQDGQQKRSKETGLKIAKAFYTKQTNNENSLNYFRGRNARWIELLLWAKGSQPMKEFLDYMSVSDANKSYINIDMTQQRIASQVVKTVVASMSKNRIYPCVSAVDDGSITEKEQRKRDALYRMYDQQIINELQNNAGIPFEPPAAFIPKDEFAANVYFELEDRLPKEIRFEKMLQKVLNDIKFDRVLNRKGLYDMTVLNFEATKIEKVAEGNYRVRRCIPTNMVYNFFLSDTGENEIGEIGEFYNLPVRDFRAKFGKSESNPEGLTEKEIYDLANISTTKNKGVFNIAWNDQWNYTTTTQNRPYDDYSIYVFDFEKDCGEDFYYVEKIDAYGKPNIQAKKGIPYQQQGQVKPDNATIIKGQKNTWMRGVYCPYGDKMLYWGEPDIIISPYTNVHKTYSSYTVNIPDNDGEYVPSLFERVLEPLREYTITKLKRKHLISQIKPFGIRIDVENARNLDLGNGDTIGWEEVLRIYNQTGTELYSSKGVDPLMPQAPALSNTVADTTIQKIVELTNVMQTIVQEIRMLIGSSVYLEGGDLGDRTAAKLAEGQTQNSSNVNDYVLNGHMQLWEETCYKLTCLHWNDVVKEEPESESDLINTRFDVAVRMRNVDEEKAMLERDIQMWGKVPDAYGNPMLTPKDAFRLRQIENYKVAEMYLADIYEENRNKAQEDKSRAEQANIKGQQESAMISAKAADKLQQDKLAQEKEIKEFESIRDKELALLNGFLAAAAKDETGRMMQMFLPAIQQLVPNIQVPLMQQNKQIVEDIQAQEQQKQMMAMQQMQQEQAEQESPQEQQMEGQMGEQQEMQQPQMMQQ